MKYPNEIYHHRNIENLPGMAYVPAEKTTIFAEDIVKLADEVTAIETELGTGPKGLNVSVAARLDAIDELFDNYSAAISELYDKHEYDVGDIFLSFNPANPADRKGYGVWTLVGAGRTLVGVDTAQSEFNTVKKTGGEKAVTLTPKNYRHNTWMPNTWTGRQIGSLFSAGSNYGINVYSTQADNTDLPGSNTAHNNLQPYLTCYIWERTA